MGAERKAKVVWEGKLADGRGRLSLLSSGVLTDTPVSWPARTEDAGGKTSPEELIAAAHCSCLAMQLSHELGEAGNAPKRLQIEATTLFDQVDAGFRLTTIHLDVAGEVPGVAETAFKDKVESAKENCPISNALKGNVAISVSASLL